MKFSAYLLFTLSFLYKIDAYDSKGSTLKGNDEHTRRTFEEKKKNLEKQFEEAKSKGWYRKMKKLAIEIVDVKTNLHQIQEDPIRREDMLLKRSSEGKKMFSSENKPQEDMDAMATFREAKVQNWMVKMLDMVNQERKKEGAKNVCLNKKLNQAAERHNKDMYDNRIFEHTGSDGSLPRERVKDAGFAVNAIGQNIARQKKSVDQVMNIWLKTEGQRANIVAPRFTMMGVAWNTEKNLWTQVFASVKSGSKEACMKLDDAGSGGSNNGGEGIQSITEEEEKKECNELSPNSLRTKAWHDRQCEIKCKQKKYLSYNFVSKEKCYCCDPKPPKSKNNF